MNYDEDHSVFLKSFKQMEKEAEENAKSKCRKAGYDVCEVITTYTQHFPDSSGGVCLYVATVKGGHSNP